MLWNVSDGFMTDLPVPQHQVLNSSNTHFLLQMTDKSSETLTKSEKVYILKKKFRKSFPLFISIHSGDDIVLIFISSILVW